VRLLEGSGRKSLYLASHASHVIGWPVEEGRQLLATLIEHATQPKYIHSHRWTPGDLVMWDNRCTMHRGTPIKNREEPRLLHRATVRDIGNSVEIARRRTTASADAA
jgi:alpha-ketoglutarate-dependent 2,4-dichlorophenoxyacetate dioxygenase